MVTLTPGVALLAALQNQFAAARQGQGQGGGSLIPGLAGQTADGSPVGSVGALGGGGISAGGVPSTATTGTSALNSLIGGSAGADPVAQQVFNSLNQQEPGERGDLGAGTEGGDLRTLLSILGGPFAAASILGNLVASNELGLPPTTSGVLQNALLGSSDVFSESDRVGREIGGNIGGPVQTGTIGTGQGSVGNIRSGFSGSEIDRGRTGRDVVNTVRAGR